MYWICNAFLETGILAASPDALVGSDGILEVKSIIKKVKFSYHEQRINRTAEPDALWNTMKDKLTKFYMEDMAPEIADPVFPGSSRCRQPTYRL
jgi:hypothetical protein